MARNNTVIEVGNYVVGLFNSPYSITNRNAICYVVRETEDNRENDIIVKVVAERGHWFHDGCEYDVSSAYFRLATEEDFVSFRFAPEDISDELRERVHEEIERVRRDREAERERAEAERERLMREMEMNEIREMTDEDEGKVEELVKAPSVMDMTAKVQMSDDFAAKELDHMKYILDEFNHEWSCYGLKKILNLWHDNKQWIENILSKHPNWDDERKMIIFKHDFYRSRDQREIDYVCTWMRNHIRIMYHYSGIDSEYSECGYVHEGDANKVNNILYAIDCFKYYGQFFTKDNCKYFNRYLREIGIPKWTIHDGQKTSKIFTRFAKEIGLADLSEWNTIQTRFCDAVNPLKQTYWTVISINPVDYWTMSFGNSWSSCHTIDRNNKRKIDSYHTYSGMYMSGCSSYMEDPATIIMYTVMPKDMFRYGHDERDFMFANKHRRCCFYLGKDKFVQSRVYPDGRDGGESSISKQFREVFEKTISDCLGVENKWAFRVGSESCGRVTESYGTHYRDYVEYDDGVAVFLKRKGILRNMDKIEIGHDPICPCCGTEHETNDSLLCYDCDNRVRCDHCDELINEDNAIHVDSRTFCCSECAEREGYVYCENVDEWAREDEVYYDDYEGVYFYDRYGDDHIITEDGHHYECEYNAEADGYHMEYITEEWVREEDLYYCDGCDHWFYEENFNLEHDCCSECAERIADEEADTELESVSA